MFSREAKKKEAKKEQIGKKGRRENHFIGPNA
jgi:hypothetical protein